MDYDAEETQDRLNIKGLYQRLGIVPTSSLRDFRCCHVNECSTDVLRRGGRFNTGTWPYVGPEYGRATICGRPARILFIAMERGGQHEPAEELELAQTERNFRKSTEEFGNHHMAGTAITMAHLVDERNPKSVSLQFALTNAVKCVEAARHMRSTTTKQMIRNCADHLRSDIECLGPDVIITQGSHPRETVTQIVKGLCSIDKFTDKYGWAELLVAGDVLVLTTPHPASPARRGFRWRDGALPPTFLREALNRTRDHFGSLNGGARP